MYVKIKDNNGFNYRENVKVDKQCLYVWRFCFMVIRGKKIVFSGKNQYGWWVGLNLIPKHFGIYMDYSY